MASGYHDGNHTPGLIAVSNADGKTPVVLWADPTSHRLLTSPGFATVDATWGAGGNTSTVTDANATTTCSIIFNVTGTTQAIGRWSVVRAAGSFVIHSSDPENSALTFSYKILL